MPHKPVPLVLRKSDVRFKAGFHLPWRRRIDPRYLLAPALAILATLIILIIRLNNDLSLIAIEDIAIQGTKAGAPIALAAIGSGLVLASRGVDLSISGTAGLAGVVFALLLKANCPLWISVVIALIPGAFVGMLLGYLVSRDMPALITSWSFGSLLTITAVVISYISQPPDTKALSISIGVAAHAARSFHDSFNCVPAYLGIVGFTMFIIAFCNLARRACAVGANRESALYAGVSIGRTVTATYTVSGLLASAAGIMRTYQNTASSPLDHLELAMTSIAVAVMGGTDMSGGFLFTPSVASAAFLWSSIALLSTGLQLSAIYQQHVASALFAIFILGVGLAIGLTGRSRTISILKDRSSE